MTSNIPRIYSWGKFIVSNWNHRHKAVAFQNAQPFHSIRVVADCSIPVSHILPFQPNIYQQAKKLTRQIVKVGFLIHGVGFLCKNILHLASILVVQPGIASVLRFSYSYLKTYSYLWTSNCAPPQHMCWMSEICTKILSSHSQFTDANQHTDDYPKHLTLFKVTKASINFRNYQNIRSTTLLLSTKPAPPRPQWGHHRHLTSARSLSSYLTPCSPPPLPPVCSDKITRQMTPRRWLWAATRRLFPCHWGRSRRTLRCLRISRSAAAPDPPGWGECHRWTLCVKRLYRKKNAIIRLYVHNKKRNIRKIGGAATHACPTTKIKDRK